MMENQDIPTTVHSGELESPATSVHVDNQGSPATSVQVTFPFIKQICLLFWKIAKKIYKSRSGDMNV
jgi:hypothetical protein